MGLLQAKQVEIARAVGVTQGMVSKWRSSQAVPNYHHRKKLFVRFGIEMDLWDLVVVCVPSPGGSLAGLERALAGARAALITEVIPT